MLTLKEINSKIRDYWRQKRSLVELKPIKKNKVPSFTRHNGNHIKRLKDSGWRYPKGAHGNKLTVPKIGYKRPDQKRFRRKTDGLLIYNVCSIKEMDSHKLKPYQVFCFKSCVGAKKRLILLEHASQNNYPVYITKRR